MTSVINRFIKNVNDHNDAPAICCNDRLFSYGEFAAIVSAIKELLPSSGEQLIGVITGDDVYTYASILAILSVGSGYVPINHKNPADRNQNIIEEAELKTIVSSRPFQINDDKINLIIVSKSLVLDSVNLTPISITDNQLAYLFFTSGSTGKPKGVPLSHLNLNTFIDNLLVNEDYKFVADDRFLQMFELTFDLSVMSFFLPMCIGACCYPVPDKGVQYLQVIKLLEEQKITVALMVPSILTYLKPYFSEIDLPAMRYSLFCGEALYQNLAEAWQPCVSNATIENVYGPTEATIYFTRYKWNNKNAAIETVNGVVSIGKPMAGLKTFIVDENNRVVAAGVTGELCLYGSQVATGYWKNTKRTNQSFIEIKELNLPSKAYKTGDLCFMNEQGNLVYCGRVDNQVKIDGYRVELGEIEHYAKQFSGKDNVVAIAANNETGNTVIHLFIEKFSEDVQPLISKLKQKLPVYMIPEKIHTIETMPYNLSGKVDRNKLKAMVAEKSLP